MCGRREREKLYGDQNYGDIPFELLEKVSREVPAGIMVQLHNNGEPLVYPRFGDAVKLFPHCITNIVTNGLLLKEKASEIIGNLDTLSISIIENERSDIENKLYFIVRDFLFLKGSTKPYTTLRFVGKIDENKWASIKAVRVRRTLHLPKGSVGYRKTPTVPEHGICLDFLNHLAIDRFGNVSCCVRFDPDGELILGNIKDQSLDEIWNCEKRMRMKKLHVEGRRAEIPFCGHKCAFWGVPTAD